MSAEDVCWRDVQGLAYLLRNSCDHVLNGRSKLRLTPTLLAKLNSAFSHISTLGSDNEFQVASGQYMPQRLTQLYFLHDFIQKTLGLTLAVGLLNNHYDTSASQCLNLSRFRSLRHLELHGCVGGRIHSDERVTNGVEGFGALRSQLETLVILRAAPSVDLVWDILSDGAVAVTPDVVWEKLSQLVVSYCGIQSVGKALSLVENLMWLDLSHNEISDAEALGCALSVLPQLNYLNLSFNRLSSIPKPCNSSASPASSQIKHLLLSHNYIDNLHGLEQYSGLVELNLVYNQLCDHSSLKLLRSLHHLQHLKLDGNPVSFHAHHRLRTAYYLPPRAVFAKHQYRRDKSKTNTFLLDGQDLNEAEKHAVQVEPGSLTTSNQHGIIDIPSAGVVGPTQVVNAPQQPIQKSSRRNRKVRHVDLEENDHAGIDIDSSSILNQTFSSLETSGNHLDTKRQLESVRQQGGDKWLLAQAGSVVQGLLGFNPSATESDLEGSFSRSFVALHPHSTSTPAVTPPETSVTATYPSVNIIDLEVIESLVLDTKRPDNTLISANDIKSTNGQGPGTQPTLYSHYHTANESDTVLQVSLNNSNSSQVLVPSTSTEISSELQVGGNEKTGGEKSISEDADDEDDDDTFDKEEEEEFGAADQPYLVHRRMFGPNNNENELDCFLKVSPRYIEERRAFDSRVVQRWLTDFLESCSLLSSSPCRVLLTFNTVVPQNKQREYAMELEEAQRLLSSLNAILEARPLSALNVFAFRCMNCSGEFTAERNSRGVTKCPTCGSSLMIELDEAPLPTLSHLKAAEQTEKQINSSQHNKAGEDLPHSPSDSSIGSAVSLESPGSAFQQMTESVTTVSTNLRRCESDIDIISNPSQSSIEVLDDVSRTSGTPNRKRSSEERQVVAIPGLLTVPEISTPLASLASGLTESSSSASLTDSVCTAYENSSAVSGVAAAKRGAPGLANTVLKEESSRENSPRYQEEREEKDDTKPGPANTLQSMLDGLLQNMSSKIESEASLKKPEVNSNQVIYNYVDYASVDHRLKLHLHMSVFDADEREELQLLLRAEVITCSPESRYPGIFVVSTRKVYIIKITGPEKGDCVDRWLSRVLAVPRGKVQTVSPLPFGAGFKIAVQGSAQGYNFVLRDQQYTTSFLNFLNRLQLDPSWKVEMSVPLSFDKATQQFLQKFVLYSLEIETEPELIHAVFLHGSNVETDKEDDEQSGGVLLVTHTSLLLCNDKLYWLCQPADECLSTSELNCKESQMIRNLVHVEANGSELALHFLDELIGKEQTWRLALHTEASLTQTVEAIKTPWEELFSIPLDVTRPQK